MQSSAAAIVVPAVRKKTATIICVHGLGDSGAGWTFLAETWRRRGKFEDVAFVFPNAPMIPITVNMGMRMPGWYDILSFDTLNRSDDDAGIQRSRGVLGAIIDAELSSGIPSSRIILGGFSQGGAMSLFTGLTQPHRLAGVFGLSCYQLAPAAFDSLSAAAPQAKDTPVWMGHGDADPLVRVEWGRATAQGLRERGWDVKWTEYPGVQHSADPEELAQLERWVETRLAAGTGGGAQTPGS